MRISKVHETMLVSFCHLEGLWTSSNSGSLLPASLTTLFVRLRYQNKIHSKWVSQPHSPYLGWPGTRHPRQGPVVHATSGSCCIMYQTSYSHQDASSDLGHYRSVYVMSWCHEKCHEVQISLQTHSSVLVWMWCVMPSLKYVVTPLM